MHVAEHRVVRRGPDSVLYQWSNSDATPSGTGWQRASKHLFPKLRSYFWFRPAENIQRDRENRRKREKAVMNTFKSQNATERLAAMLSPNYWLSKMPQPVTERVEKNTRVKFNGRVHYVKHDKGDAVDVTDAITGETRSVNHEELDMADEVKINYGRGDLVNITPGVIHSSRDDIDGVVIGFDEETLKYKIAVGQDDADTANPSTFISVFPESINALVTKVDENTIELKQKLHKVIGGPFSEESKKVIDIVETAAKTGRSAISEKEVYDLLTMSGNAVSRDTIAGTFASIKGYVPSAEYNSDSGVLFIRNSKKSLHTIRKELDIPRRVEDVSIFNQLDRSKSEMMIHEDQQVVTKDGLLEGVVKKIEGRTVFLLNKAGQQVQTELNKLLDFKTRKKVVMDPSHPAAFGKLNTSDVFWLLRDRESCRDIKLGEPITLLPGLQVPGRVNTSFTARHKGRVKAILNDGTVRVTPDDGGEDWVVSPRQLMVNKKFKDIGEFHKYMRIKRSESFDRTMHVGNTEVLIGANPGVLGGNKHVTLTFQNGKEYSDNENVFFDKAKLPGTGSLFSHIPLLGSLTAPDETLVPSKTMVDVLARLYPNAKTVTIAREKKHDGLPIENSAETVKISFKINDKSAQGRDVSLSMLKEVYASAKGKAVTKGSDLSDVYSIRMDADEDKKRVVLKVGRDWEKAASDLPQLLKERKVRDEMGKVVIRPSNDIIFRDVVMATTGEKRDKWQQLPDYEELVKDSSVFTYDPSTRQYSFDYGNYDRAHRFLRRFFGDTAYERSMWESEDGAFYARAHEKILSPTTEACQKVRKQQDASKTNTADFTDDELNGFFIPLRKYQNAAVHFSSMRDSSLLAMDQGTGKTYSAIADAVLDLNRWKSKNLGKKKVLIVAPASVAQTSWVNSLATALGPTKMDSNDKPIGTSKSARFPNRKRLYDFTLLMGENRVEAYKKLADENDKTCIAVTSFETFANSDYKELRDIGFDKVIIDEAQTIKNSKESAVIAQKIKMAMADAERKLALTGTPIENSPSDIQSILGWLDPENFGDAEKFMQDFVETDFVDTFDAKGKKIKRAVGIDLKNKEALRHKLDGLMFRIDKEDLLKEDSPFRELVDDVPNTITVDKLVDGGVLDRYMKMPEGAAKKRLGEISVIPNKVPYDSFELAYDGNRLSLNGGNEGLYIEDFPDYHRLVSSAKMQLRSEYMQALRRGEHPNYNTIFTRLQQVMNDPSLVSDAMGLEYSTPVRNPKVEALINHVKSHFGGGDFSPKANGKILIFTYEMKTVRFIEKQLAEAFPQLKGRILKFVGQGDEAATSRGDLERKFNRDPEFKYPIMIANAAAKTGVNLPTANFVINYDIGWNPQDLAQRIDRAHRVRSIESIAKDKSLGLPPRNVFTTVLGVISKSGDINATIESRKIATHRVKQRMFDTIVRGKDPQKLQLGDDHAARAEALLGASNPTGDIRVDAGEQRRNSIARYARRRVASAGRRPWYEYFTG